MHAAWQVTVHSRHQEGVKGVQKCTLVEPRYPGKACQCMCCILNAHISQMSCGRGRAKPVRAAVNALKGPKTLSTWGTNVGDLLNVCSRGTCVVKRYMIEEFAWISTMNNDAPDNNSNNKAFAGVPQQFYDLLSRI